MARISPDFSRPLLHAFRCTLQVRGSSPRQSQRQYRSSQPPEPTPNSARGDVPGDGRARNGNGAELVKLGVTESEWNAIRERLIRGKSPTELLGPDKKRKTA